MQLHASEASGAWISLLIFHPNAPCCQTDAGGTHRWYQIITE